MEIEKLFQKPTENYLTKKAIGTFPKNILKNQSIFRFISSKISQLYVNLLNISNYLLLTI